MTSFLMGLKEGNMQKSMIEGNTLKLILNFSIPLLLGNLFQQFYNVVDATAQIANMPRLCNHGFTKLWCKKTR
ncbi:hypothetical protein [Holdemanella biformis]|uniref:hypothetical protein n=1 Tax=Holdemanella biformis TaxID=1735 RepID=UPI0022E03665|nr:hypothetical protein [Holdemanella biformis]